MDVESAGDLARGVTQKGLHRAQRRSYAIQERGMGMPERVLIDARQAELLGRRRQLAASQVAPG